MEAWLAFHDIESCILRVLLTGPFLLFLELRSTSCMHALLVFLLFL